VWRQGNQWGDDSLLFELRRGDGAVVPVRMSPQVYTRNVPAPVEIPTGGTHRMAFDLGTGAWEPGDAIPGARELAAVLEIAASPEAEQHRVWKGRTISPFVPLT
jgi:hypothetical protein